MQTVLDQHYAGGAHLLRPADDRFWAFDGTRWAPLGKQVLSGIVLAAIQAMPGRRGQSTASLMRQVTSLIEARVAADGDPLRFIAQPLPVINCRNGELWIDSRGAVELRPHRAGSYLRHRLEVDYDPAAICPRYDEAVRQIFGKAPDPAAMVSFWHDLMGYALQPDRRTPLVVLGWGTGNNGKTRLLHTYMRLVGLDLVIAMPIGEIEKSRFTTGSLLGKFALIDDDVTAGTRLPDGHLKRLSEEKVITGENKFGPPFTFTARTAIFMLFNNPPSLADLSHGMQRRLVVVPFDRSFTPEETNKGLFQEIWAAEMPGVLNRYLAGLRRVIERGWNFAPPEAAERKKAKLLEAANPIPAFVEECCERSGAAYVQDLYDAYNEWARRAGITLQQQRRSFQRNLEALGFQAGRGKHGPRLHGLRLRAACTSSWPRRPQP
jgi:P4 family phage/plasmid primase-like protien